MFPTRDPYQKFHRRRRDGSRRLALVIAATLLAGCAAAAVMLEDEPLTAEREDHMPLVVAHLTAYDAVSNALHRAEPELEIARPQMPTAPAAPALPQDWTSGTPPQLAGELQRDESISTALARRGVPSASAHGALAALRDVVNFRRSKIGDAWEVDVDAGGGVTRLRYAASATDVWEVRRADGVFAKHRIDVPVETRTEVVSGTIEASLWQAFETAGADGRLAAAFAHIFAYTIDFATETQTGDRFYIAFESTWLGDERLATTKILGARYSGAAGDHSAFRWDDAYYDGAGESVERQFLRSPLATTRITSSYGRRFHPVLGKMKMHAGVDYGAPTGTPVQAVADGKVTWAGWRGANGNLVSIQHAGGYVTHYAHLSRVSSDLRVGKRVKKSAVIGKVGSTGRSTGPHLHFGMTRGGKSMNPLEVDFERGTPLSKAERAKYLAATADMRTRLQ